MMPAALWWRLVSVWLCVLALVSWHPSCYVGCTEQLQEATSLPAQDIVSEEEQSENTQTAEESWVSHVHSLSDDELMTAGQGPGEDLDTPALAEEDEDEEQGPEAVRADEPAAEVKLETVTDDAAAAAAAAAPAGEPEPDAQLPDTPPPTITQDQQPAVSPEPSPASPASSGVDVTPDAVSDSAEAPSISASQDQTLSSGSDHVESDMPPLEPSDEHLATTDCEAGEANPYDDASPPVVLENTSNAHIAGTKTHADPAMSPQPARSAESLGGNTSHMLKEKGLSPPVAAETQTQTDSSAGSKDPEDYPTFDEWKRKVLEVEKEKTQATHTSTNGAPVPVKKVPKNFNNYASVECGAKILGSNPEAKSTSAILMENMDMYMLNPCSNKIWFIIELCEPIQLKQLDIANFELFSSTPKDFLVSISDRYPTNKWLKLGTFHGRDERTVQSFPLDEHVYAKYVKMFTKYIKVELISHFGSEHFCPLSLIRVFGTSMVEEYEEIADPSERPDDQDDDLDYPPGYVPGEIKSSKNLIGSAKDAILNMVNTAANVFGGSSEMQGNASFQELNMTEPPLQTEANTEAVGSATTVAPMPDAEEAEILVDSDIPATEAPLLDLPTPELPITESTELELPPVEDGIVTLLPEDVEESISSTITLLGEEEDEDEEREAKEKRQRQYERTDCCGPFSFSSHPSSSTLCSCSSSLQEYLMQQCSTRLSKQRKAQIPESKATITPHPYLPALKVPLSPPASPLAQPPHTEINQPQDQELDPGAAETAAGPSEVPHIPGNVTEPQTESVSEPTLLEPSQTSSLPKPSATESPTAKSTPAAELPQHSSKGLPKEPRPDGSQDELAAEKQGGTTVSPSVSVPVPDRPSGSAAVEHVSEPPTDDKPKLDFSQSGQDPPLLASESAEPAHTPQPSTTSEQQPVPPAVPENGSPAPEELLPAPTTASEPDHSEGLSATATESKVDLDLTEDMIFTSTNGQLPRPSSTSPPSSSSSSPIHSEFYAELHNMTEQGNGNQVHGSSQNKESVFMRLNNRIKALEMNMSLSGRYLEQLSQRYRKQMEEMQKAFNKTIIKLQNTARMAEEQDLRQTESIQSLQGQLENITQLVLNLSVRVSQLQSEVSDRQSYLLASLTLCLFLGLILCANRCNASADIEPPDLLAEQPEPPEPRSYSNCERQFASCDDTWLKRRASYPLLHSDSLQIPTTEGPESLPTVETQRFSPANRKKRRAKVKAREGVETLKASLPAPELTNGFAACNGVPHAANPANRLLHPAFKDSPSEGSSEGGSSSHSDDPSFCGIATVCTRLYDGLPPARTKAEKRALRRRRPKPVSSVVDLLQAPRRDKSDHLPASSTLQDLRSNELSSGTFNTALSGPA